MSVRHASKSVVDALPLSRSSTYVCRQCRRNAHPSQILLQQRKYASDRNGDLPLAERVRRKLWKGKPPGPENVDELYGGPGALETMFKDRRERRARTKYSDDPPEPQASAEQPTEPLPEQEDVRRELRQPGSARPVREDSATARATPLPPRAELQPADSQRQAKPEFGDVLSVSESDSEYKQATTWDGLKIIGHKGHWKEMPVRAEDEYKPWLVPSPIPQEWSYSDLVCLMHQAIVDLHVLKQSNMGSEVYDRLNSTSPTETREDLQNASFRLSADGTVEAVDGLTTLTNVRESCYFPEHYPEHKEAESPEPVDLKNLSYEEEAAIIARTEPPMINLRPRHLYTPTDTSFLDARLDIADPETFMILKRFSKITNHTIPDPLLSNLNSADPTRNTIRTFLTGMAEKTKNKGAKIAEQLLKDEKLAAQANLLVLGRRETPVDKEKEVGRWKVIEEELRSRGLPVLGRAQVQR